MVRFTSACDTAQMLSGRYENRMFRVYRTPSGNHWVRQDNVGLSELYSVKILEVGRFMNGKEIFKIDNPTFS